MKSTTIKQKAILITISALLVATTGIYAQRGEHGEHRGWGEREDRDDEHGRGWGWGHQEREEAHERMERNERGYGYYGRSRPSVQVSIGTYPGYYDQRPHCSPYPRAYAGTRFSFGLRFGILPSGYISMNYGGNPFYYYNGAFLRSYGNYYEVVEAPIGAEVPFLPENARATIYDGDRLYECNGNYYEPFRRRGEVWFRVISQ
ncbi:MAG: hypothetical protein K2Q21_05050 [Chitinophagaceae bacterium]|nr:hypothetical protein [Chitinophagaceae bacterium]